MQTKVTIIATFEHDEQFDFAAVKAGLLVGLREAFIDEPLKIVKDEFGADDTMIDQYRLSAFGFVAEDVIEHAEQNGYIVDEKQANEILDWVLSKGDASVGVSWDTILYFIEEYAKEKGIEQIETDED